MYDGEENSHVIRLMVYHIVDSLYQDPTTLACTGPPGTPSPIRDALHSSSAHQQDDLDSSDIYANADFMEADAKQLRGDPDGESTLRRDEPL